jgi:hypothetical protein
LFVLSTKKFRIFFEPPPDNSNREQVSNNKAPCYGALKICLRDYMLLLFPDMSLLLSAGASIPPMLEDSEAGAPAGTEVGLLEAALEEDDLFDGDFLAAFFGEDFFAAFFAPFLAAFLPAFLAAFFGAFLATLLLMDFLDALFFFAAFFAPPLLAPFFAAFFRADFLEAPFLEADFLADFFFDFAIVVL